MDKRCSHIGIGEKDWHLTWWGHGNHYSHVFSPHDEQQLLLKRRKDDKMLTFFSKKKEKKMNEERAVHTAARSRLYFNHRYRSRLPRFLPHGLLFFHAGEARMERDRTTHTDPGLHLPPCTPSPTRHLCTSLRLQTPQHRGPEPPPRSQSITGEKRERGGERWKTKGWGGRCVGWRGAGEAKRGERWGKAKVRRHET